MNPTPLKVSVSANGTQGNIPKLPVLFRKDSTLESLLISSTMNFSWSVKLRSSLYGLWKGIWLINEMAAILRMKNEKLWKQTFQFAILRSRMLVCFELTHVRKSYCSIVHACNVKFVDWPKFGIPQLVHMRETAGNRDCRKWNFRHYHELIVDD